MRALAPLAILAAALVALFDTPPGTPLLGLSHDDFARGALGVAILVWLMLSGMARAGPGGAARVLSGVALWAAFAVLLVAVYTYRFEFSEIADRVMAELGPPQAEAGRGGEVVVRRRFGGEFVVPGKVNGAPVSFVFDTGATSLVLSAEDAEAAGLHFAPDDYSVDVTTANGSTTAAPARLAQVSVGGIVVRNVRALAARPDALRQSLLGMTFLDRLKSFTVERGKLVLRGN